LDIIKWPNTANIWLFEPLNACQAKPLAFWTINRPAADWLFVDRVCLHPRGESTVTPLLEPEPTVQSVTSSFWGGKRPIQLAYFLTRKWASTHLNPLAFESHCKLKTREPLLQSCEHWGGSINNITSIFTKWTKCFTLCRNQSCSVDNMESGQITIKLRKFFRECKLCIHRNNQRSINLSKIWFTHFLFDFLR
jgi:hypothetical protein